MIVEQKFKDLLKSFEKDLGFHQADWIQLEKPFSFEIYHNWIKNGSHGEMTYLEDHLAIKENPQLKWPQARTAIVFLAPYYPHQTETEFPLSQTRVALYAHGSDYHHWFKEKLEIVIAQLKVSFPDEFFYAATDSVPLIERDLGAQAGLGWIGKNSCLIHPKKGSFFFIGEILTSLSVAKKEEIKPLHDFCGTCQRCIEVCPTQAIEPDRTLTSTKCLAYWSIESRAVPPAPIREKMGDQFFGCDLCQTVCPWNQKIFKDLLEITPLRNLASDQRSELIEEMKMILSNSGKSLERLFAKTPLSRAGSFGLKRNALIVVANQNLTECLPEVLALKEHPKLGDLAIWTAEKLKS